MSQPPLWRLSFDVGKGMGTSVSNASVKKSNNLELRSNLELLSPAGSFEGFLCALKAGADAVYAGGRAFGARAYATNFSDEELIEAIDIAHLLGRRFYLTVNTLCKQREFDALFNYLLPLYKAGLDGVIVQDIGVIHYIRNCFPDMEVHASTQMTLTNVPGAEYLKSLGVTRIVPARELSLSEIKQIHDTTGIEIEAFIHGAMCYCYSGQCLMSSFLGGRSGNRGRCAQPCRLPYETYIDNKKVNSGDEEYILSMKDLCTLKLLPDLIESGVTSFKIEGRMKKPEYTGFVTSMYRKYIDMYLDNGREGFRVSDKDFTALTDFYKRSETEDGYYKKHNGRSMITLNKPSYASDNDVISVDQTDLTIKVDAYASFICDQPAVFTLVYKDYAATVYGDVCQMAQKRPLLVEDFKKQLSKTGGSMFSYKELSIETGDNVFLPVGAINSLRRNAFDELKNIITADFKRSNYNEAFDAKIKRPAEATSAHQNTPLKRVLVNSAKQLKAVLSCMDKGTEINRIYIESALLKSDISDLDSIRRRGTDIYVALPYIFRAPVQRYIQELFEDTLPFLELINGFLIRNYEELSWCKNNYPNLNIVADHNLYSFNSFACRQLTDDGISELTYPLELNIYELKEREYNDISELFYYGKNHMMISAGCVHNTLKGCKKTASLSGSKSPVYIKDRMGKTFKVITECVYCYNKILNSVPISLMGRSEEVTSLSPRALRYEFTDEGFDEIVDILLNNTEPSEYTRGHFKKSVE